MKSLLKGIFSYAIVFLGFQLAQAADEISLSQLPPSVTKSIDAVKIRLADFYKKTGYDNAFLMHSYKAYKKESIAYQQEIFELEARNYYDFDVLPDGQVIQFSREGVKKGVFDQPTESTWPKEKLIMMGKEFLEAFLGHPLKDISNPYLYYMKSPRLSAYSDQGMTRFGAGYWSLGWGRIDEKTQALFESDHYSCSISEDEGVLGAGLTLTSNFSRADFTPISKEDALPIAIAASKKMLQWQPLNGWFDGGNLDEKPYQAYLSIIQPNHWGTKEVTSIYAKPDLNARLVWEFWFPWYPNGMKHDPTKPIQRGVAVFIDAQTKEWLGGNAGGM